jgi:hypothetical protein
VARLGNVPIGKRGAAPATVIGLRAKQFALHASLGTPTARLFALRATPKALRATWSLPAPQIPAMDRGASRALPSFPGIGACRMLTAFEDIHRTSL